MKIFIVLIVTLLSMLVRAQSLPDSISVVLSKKQLPKFTNQYSTSIVYALSNGETVIIEPNGYRIHHFDENMNLIKDTDICESEKNMFISSAVFGNNLLYVFGAQYDGQNSMWKFIVKEFNPETFFLIREISLFDVALEKGKFLARQKVIMSKDMSKIATITRCDALDKKEALKISCFDSELNLLWSQNDVEIDDYDEFLNNFQIDNAGNIYRLHITKIGDETKIALSFYTDDESGAHSTALDLENYIYSEISFNINEEYGAIIMFYGNSECTAKGVVFAGYDKKRDILNDPVLSEFPSSILENEMCYGKTEGLFSYCLRKLIPLKNGNYAFVSEQTVINNAGSLVRQGCIKEKGDGIASNYYNNGSFLVVIFSPKGEVLHFIKVPKVQQAGFDTYTHSGIFSDGKSIYFLFNDNPKNTGRESNNPLAYYGNKKCSNVLVTVNGKGYMHKYVFPDEITTSLFKFIPYSNNDSTFLYIGGSSKVAVGKITVK